MRILYDAIFVSKKGFVKVYVIKSEKEFIQALKLCCKGVEALKDIIVDPRQAQTKREIYQLLKKLSTIL